MGDFQRKGSEVMKKIVYALLLAASLVLLTACGNGKDTTGKEEENPDKQTAIQKGAQDESEDKESDESEDKMEKVLQKALEDKLKNKENPDIDKDYKGDIPCPKPPQSSPYKTSVYVEDYTKPHKIEDILIYVENIDDANFKFYFTKAVLTDERLSEEVWRVEEEVIFIEHIAHYNGNGFYEYEGDGYHLYFKYYDTGEGIVASHKLEVYGQEGIYSTKEYSRYIQYNGMNGNIFQMGQTGSG